MSLRPFRTVEALGLRAFLGTRSDLTDVADERRNPSPPTAALGPGEAVGPDEGVVLLEDELRGAAALITDEGGEARSAGGNIGRDHA